MAEVGLGRAVRTVCQQLRDLVLESLQLLRRRAGQRSTWEGGLSTPGEGGLMQPSG